MKDIRMIIGVILALLASTLCIVAGVYLLGNIEKPSDNVLATAIGLYFIGKGLFVGPMLLFHVWEPE